ncbi:TNFAIP3-interacting protein 1, partial [Austrofundulus limnaeus]|uniref:TNFAIP3-interacting protein 1 n=1 Tax=Austrofundulus limnaeus TaxID=52670 RepID=A0A2I4BAD1_AUSLI
MSSATNGDVLSLSSSSSLPSLSAGSQEHGSSKSDSSLPPSQQENTSTKELWSGTENVSPMEDRLLSTDEQVTLITESLTVTSTDQEKLLLLNKNTELRRVNKELMKLNEDWDQVYRSATLGLQHRLEALELENSAIKQLNSRLLLKAEHQQSAKEYYEQSLMTELKKNQELQEYIRLLENRLHQADKGQGGFSVVSPGSCPNAGHISGCSPSSFFTSPSPETGWKEKKHSSSSLLLLGNNSQKEMQDLREQLEALKCQTEIYEAEYQTEHNDHKHTLQENRRLRKKREEMRQQVNLLQEQLKIYEDDFRRDRSDKQVLQRLLLQKAAPNKDPVLIHRCNNEQQLLGGEKRAQSGEKRKQQVNLLQEQLKIYEDDFRRERSDKQVLQRLLLQKAAPNKDPVLIHRCNNEQQLLGGEKRAQSGEKRKQQVNLLQE